MGPFVLTIYTRRQVRTTVNFFDILDAISCDVLDLLDDDFQFRVWGYNNVRVKQFVCCPEVLEGIEFIFAVSDHFDQCIDLRKGSREPSIHTSDVICRFAKWVDVTTCKPLLAHAVIWSGV